MAFLTKLSKHIEKSLYDGFTNNPSARRLVFFGYACLGALMIVFGLGFASAFLVMADTAARLSYFATLLDFIKSVFTIGVAGSGLTYGVTRIFDSKLAQTINSPDGGDDVNTDQSTQPDPRDSE